MIDFMLIGLPRSGTTWAANWLTTDHSTCIHDPLYRKHYSDWDKELFQESTKLKGISCTGIWRWPDWVNAHPAKKLILRRDQDEIQGELLRLGINLESDAEDTLLKINAPMVDYASLFQPETAKEIWSYLLDIPFDIERHRELVCYLIQPKFDAIFPDPVITKNLYQELANY